MGRTIPKRIVYCLLAFVLLTGAVLGGRYVYEAASSGDDRASGLSALIQYGLTIFTLMLVFVTALVAVGAQRGTQRSAHESLRLRLDARGPFATVYHTGTYAFVDKVGRSYVPHQGGAYTLDVESLDEYTVDVGVKFTVIVHSDAPAFGAVVFPTTATIMDLNVVPLLPRQELKPTVTWHTQFTGQEILEIAEQGEWHPNKHGPMIEAHVAITDTTRTVVDRYAFKTAWWPFALSNGQVKISRSDECIPLEGLVTPAIRSYDESRARMEKG